MDLWMLLPQLLSVLFFYFWEFYKNITIIKKKYLLSIRKAFSVKSRYINLQSAYKVSFFSILFLAYCFRSAIYSFNLTVSFQKKIPFPLPKIPSTYFSYQIIPVSFLPFIKPFSLSVYWYLFKFIIYESG